MRWEDERYVRIYTRDSIDWLGLSFIAQGLFCLLLRKVDRAGLLKLGKPGKRGVAIIIGFPGEWSRLEPALDELVSDGCIEVRGDTLIVPNFIEAQEAVMSEAQRKRESRARARDIAASRELLNPDKVSDSVTECHESGQKVTSGHAASRTVTPSCAVPSVPCLAAAAAEPAAATFGRELARVMARTMPYPVGANEAEVLSSLQASLQAVPVFEAVEICRDRILATDTTSRRAPNWNLRYFAQVLSDEADRRKLEPVRVNRVADACPKPGDPDFNEQDAWPTYEAFLARDAKGAAHA